MEHGIKLTIFFLTLSFLLVISVSSFAEPSELQVPMYDATDSSFIASAINSFGTSEHASEGYVERAFDNYSSNKFEKSMQKFNQAWLLNPDNAYVYLGFGLLLKKKEQTCPSYKMFKLANEKGLKEKGFLADYAYTTSQCALLKEEKEKQQLFIASNNLHQTATEIANERLLAYVYHSWAKSYVLQEDFAKAEEMVEKSRSFGGTINSSLLQALKSKN